jgi:hypothetical protein
MRAIGLILFFSLLVSGSTAQVVVTELKKLGNKKKLVLDTTGWKKTGVFILNVNQSMRSGTNNGGENFLLGINSILNKSVHHKKGKYTFDSYLDLELGLVYASSYKKFRKTTDRFDLTVELDHKIGNNKHFTYGFLGNINTQLFPGYNYVSDFHFKVSNILSPGKALISFGLDYKDVKKTSYLSLFITPATVRWVTKVDREFYRSYKFGVDSFHKVYTEIGAYLTVHYNKQFSEKVNLVSRLDLFSNYKRDPNHVDVFSNNILSLMFSRRFSCTFVVDLLYDHDVSTKLQLQQQSGIGLRLKL